jgi:RNA polymerase sigma-54 factor
MMVLSPRQTLLSEEFLGNIKEDGYLAASVEEIQRMANEMLDSFAERNRPDSEEELAEAGDLEAEGEPEAKPAPPMPYFTAAELDEMLGIMQRLDPPGVAARDLRECLLLQLREFKETNTLTYRLVAEAFPDLIAHRWNDLGRRFGVEPAAVQAAADLLAKLDPKPGLKYSAGSDGYVIPDLIVEKIDGRYHVFLNDTGVPRLRLSRTYQELARDKKKMTQEHREFIASRMNSANWLIQAIEQRRQTMLKVMNFIVDRQRDFFEKGIEHLKPLTLREVAEVINMHESTVSRVTNEKYVQTPRGVLPLKFFFSSALATTSGEDASARSIRAKLQKMVAEEDTSNPLTDQQIVHLFQEQGIQIARRTVAKYRDQLGILPARMRKRV